MSVAPEKVWWQEQGYLEAREIEGGQWLILNRMVFTWRLMIGNVGWIDDFYCYEHLIDAVRAFVTWDGRGDAPGAWHRHFATGRRRPGGDPAAETVRD